MLNLMYIGVGFKMCFLLCDCGGSASGADVFGESDIVTENLGNFFQGLAFRFSGGNIAR